MFEILTGLGPYKLPDLVAGYTAIATLPAPKTGRLDAALFSIGGVNYLYGGHNESYAVQNDLYTFTPTTNFAATSVFPLGTVAIAFPKAVINGTKVYIFGVNTSGFFAVKILETSNNTVETIVSTEKPSGNQLYVPPGVDYNAGTNSYYIKFSASNAIGKFDLATKTFSTLVMSGSNLSSGAFIGNEYLLCGTDGIYTFAGWNVSVANLVVHKTPYAGGVIVDHGRMENDSRHSVNQGYIVKNKLCYYPTWSGASITFNTFDPENLRHGNPIYVTGITYRNATSMGPSANGMFFAGGTPTAVGGSGWMTSTRRTDVYDISINFNANQPF